MVLQILPMSKIRRPGGPAFRALFKSGVPVILRNPHKSVDCADYMDSIWIIYPSLGGPWSPVESDSQRPWARHRPKMVLSAPKRVHKGPKGVAKVPPKTGKEPARSHAKNSEAMFNIF